MISREELIEKAPRAAEHWRWAQERRERFQDQGCICEVCEILAVFEKAHAPSDDERFDIISAASEAFKARGGAPDWEEDAIARDLIIRWHLRGFEDGLAAGSRRPVSPEPQGREAKVHGDLVTMRVDEWRRITDELTRLRTAEAEPQGEPSDAQLLAALNSYEAWSAEESLDMWGSDQVERMRAALRAAAAATEQGEF